MWNKKDRICAGKCFAVVNILFDQKIFYECMFKKHSSSTCKVFHFSSGYSFVMLLLRLLHVSSNKEIKTEKYLNFDICRVRTLCQTFIFVLSFCRWNFSFNFMQIIQQPYPSLRHVCIFSGEIMCKNIQQKLRNNFLRCADQLFDKFLEPLGRGKLFFHRFDQNVESFSYLLMDSINILNVLLTAENTPSLYANCSLEVWKPPKISRSVSPLRHFFVNLSWNDSKFNFFS